MSNLIYSSIVSTREYDSNAACDGTSQGIVAGDANKGVQGETSLNVVAPLGATSMTYFYSHDVNNLGEFDFQVIVNYVIVRDYTGAAISCQQDCIFVSEGDLIRFSCANPVDSGNGAFSCSLDEVQFFGSSGRRLLLSEDSGDGDKVDLSTVRPSKPSIPETPKPATPRERPSHPFASTFEPVCTHEPSLQEKIAGETCSDEPDGKFNCCLNSGDYSCETCSACHGWGQLLNGLDENGRSW